MKNLRDIIEGHSFLVNRKLNNRQKDYKFYPKSWHELKDIIVDLLKQGETDLNCIDVSEIISMQQLFKAVNENVTVEEIDISDWNVSNVCNMCWMFEDCEEFNADLSKWDVSNVTDMDGMFRGCENFNSDLSKWNVSRVKNMTGMFSKCKNFKSDLSKWNVYSLTDMNFMFSGCENFDSDLSGWRAPKRYWYSNMFCGCTKMKKNNMPYWCIS